MPQNSITVTAKLICTFVFATPIVLLYKSEFSGISPYFLLAQNGLCRTCSETVAQIYVTLEKSHASYNTYIDSKFKDLCVVTVYTCMKIYLYKNTLLIFVNNVAFFSMLYHGAVEYVANTWICDYILVK